MKNPLELDYQTFKLLERAHLVSVSAILNPWKAMIHNIESSRV